MPGFALAPARPRRPPLPAVKACFFSHHTYPLRSRCSAWLIVCSQVVQVT